MMLEIGFHTIKSILNSLQEGVTNIKGTGFHTIKSILNWCFKWSFILCSY